MTSYRGCTWPYALHAFLWDQRERADPAEFQAMQPFHGFAQIFGSKAQPRAHSQSHCANPVPFRSRSEDTRRSFEDTTQKPTGSRSLRS